MYLLRAVLNIWMQWLTVAFSTFTEFTTQSATKGKVILLCKLNLQTTNFNTNQKFVGYKPGNQEDDQLNQHGVIQTICQLTQILQGHSVPTAKKVFEVAVGSKKLQKLLSYMQF